MTWNRSFIEMLVCIGWNPKEFARFTSDGNATWRTCWHCGVSNLNSLVMSWHGEWSCKDWFHIVLASCPGHSRQVPVLAFAMEDFFSKKQSEAHRVGPAFRGFVFGTSKRDTSRRDGTAAGCTWCARFHLARLPDATAWVYNACWSCEEQVQMMATKMVSGRKSGSSVRLKPQLQCVSFVFLISCVLGSLGQPMSGQTAWTLRFAKLSQGA